MDLGLGTPAVGENSSRTGFEEITIVPLGYVRDEKTPHWLFCIFWSLMFP